MPPGTKSGYLYTKIRPDLLERLRKEADDRVVGVSILVERALERYLDDLVPLEELERRRRERPAAD